MPPNTAFTRIYCKIFCDDFSDDGFSEGKVATGPEIYSFLTRELGYAIDPETDEAIPGDYAIWYLGSNEKFGILQADTQISEWTFGESNWERVFDFLHILHKKKVLSDEHFNHLVAITSEGFEAFDDACQIPAYLKAKQNNIPWHKKESNTKAKMKQMVADVHEILISSGWQVIS